MFLKHRQAGLCHAQDLPGYEGHRMEGKLPETSFLLKAVVARRMKSFQVYVCNPAVDGLSFKSVGLPGERQRRGARKHSVGQAGHSDGTCTLGYPSTAHTEGPKGLPMSTWFSLLVSLPSNSPG